MDNSNYASYSSGPFHNDAELLNMPQEDAGMGMAMGGFVLDDEQAFDDMAAQDEDKANRRKSVPVYAGAPMHANSTMDSRRFSLMPFGNGATVDIGDFQFDPHAGAQMGGGLMSNSAYAGNDFQNERLQINTHFAPQDSHFANLHTPASAYTSPLDPNVSLGLDMHSSYPGDPSLQMHLNDPSMAIMQNDMNMFSGTQFQPSMLAPPIAPGFLAPGPPPGSDAPAADLQGFDQYRDQSLATTPEVPSGMTSHTNSDEQSTSLSRPRSAQLPPQATLQNRMPVQGPQPDYPIESFAQMQMHAYLKANKKEFPSTEIEGGKTHVTMERFRDAYSVSRFDMMGCLTRVAQRPNPQIDIGRVDFSCAFVVCDVNEEDCPIVFCSDNFQNLTGYRRDDIIGKNCRFLQAPDGLVKPGTQRQFCDHHSIVYLKKAVDTYQEAQVSLINYRNGGQSFMNLLTMIPIAWEPGGPITHIVGFQVDLLENPSSMENKNTDGSFRINYQRDATLPNYVYIPPMHKPRIEIGRTISNDEISNVLATYGSAGETELSRRIWDKVLLENTDDVIIVLSLKGIFLYLSPSSNKVLEYDPSELTHTGLSSVCHPSDIVPVTRELKETTSGSSVNIVFRIRRKKSGYMWFEGHGALHTEQGKGRKCIILVGRKRPVYTVSKRLVAESEGIGESEIWSKMSTSGMFLFVSSNVRQLLDRQPEELVGTGIQALMRPESKQNFGRMLEQVRMGRKAEVLHEIFNRRGQVLQAKTYIYPGDAVEGQKPTFIVGQTRLLKARSAGQRPSLYKTKEHSGDSRGSVPSVMSGQSPVHSGNGGTTPVMAGSDNQFGSMEAPAPGFPARNNHLLIGHQDQSLASDDNIFDELKTTRSTSWQYELRQMEKANRFLYEEVQTLMAAKKKRKRRKGSGNMQKDCANCHTRNTPEWRRGPSGQRDLCNSCGLRWAKQNGRVSPRNSSHNSASDKGKKSVSPRHTQQAILPNRSNGPHAQVPMTSPLVQGEKRVPGQASVDSHVSKVARMEATAPQGYGGGIPTRIDEGDEPDDA